MRIHTQKTDRNKIIHMFAEYKHKPVKNLKVSNHKVSFTYGKERISDPYKLIPHEPHIGDWNHKIGDNTIRIDKDVKKRNRTPLLVHEGVEQFLQKRKGLPYSLAHEAALEAERKVVKKRHQNWKTYEVSVLHTKL